ncbi:zinc-binding dehydrogenase [Enterococcus avium]|nr:zinc-binding dehydrogenase [Enterococcus avium]
MMKTKAVRLYGKEDLRLEEFELPKIKRDEILMKIVTDSICMSTWKLAKQGEDHKKSPNDLKKEPVIIGHEFCGELVQIGDKWRDNFKKGQKYVCQANLQLPDDPSCPGYSYVYCGGDATYIVIPNDVMKQDCLLEFNGDTYFEGSLVEPLSCVVGAFKANYHLKPGSYDHQMGIKEQGNFLLLGGTGPMGLLTIDYALHGERKPRNLVVTDLHEDKLARAEKLYPSTDETTAYFINVAEQSLEEQKAALLKIAPNGFDDIFVMVPTEGIVALASDLLAEDGCLNFFAGPQNRVFRSSINFYNVHYYYTHYVGTSGGTTEDMRDAINLIENKTVDVAKIVTHILGLDAVAETTLKQPEIGGGKKLVYVEKEMERQAIDDIDPSSELGKILAENQGIWSKTAENYLLEK